MHPSFKCLAIIVSFNPQRKPLEKLIDVISLQVDQVILIDNASETCPLNNLADDLKQHIEYIQLADNLGLGAAHNQGIEYAEKHQYSHVLIMDQDSLPSADMVTKLYQAEQRLINKGIALAAVGPQFISVHDTNKTAFIYENKSHCSRIFCQENEFIQTEHLISSGSLIRVSVLSIIGKMNEDLFIDFVDIEWGLRAKALNYFCYGICSALMNHQLGDDNVYVKPLNRRIVLHSSLRYYYQYRNAIILYQYPFVSWAWIRYHFPRHLLIKFILIIFFIPNRKKNIPKVLLGIWHGIRNRSGKLK
jgi:rhamnosyltransferase